VVEIANVFVTDSQMRSSLAVIRSLGKKGLHVTGGETTRFATGFFSKYCERTVVYPSPEKEENEFVKFLINELKNNDYDVLFPVADACLKPIINNYDTISEYTKIALPRPEIFLKGYTKETTLQIAAENNIPHPKTLCYHGNTDPAKFREYFEFPVIIKPSVSSGSRGTSVCVSFEELEEKIHDAYVKYGTMLVQEYIPNGGELGVYTLFDKQSVPRALSVQRRLRSYPVSGGPSTLRETIRNDGSRLATDIAFRLLKKMQWTGVAMVEFRIDARDGMPKLMEVNPRFWGSLQLSVLSGIDFPYLLYCMLMEKDFETVMNYKEGVQCRWLLPGDILWYVTSPDKAKNVKELMRFDIPDDILSLDDPGPTFGFFAATMRYLFDREMWNFVLRR
jgi:predicted ATP-grasp superfamily ATP-dependent carboligase